MDQLTPQPSPTHRSFFRSATDFNTIPDTISALLRLLIVSETTERFPFALLRVADSRGKVDLNIEPTHAEMETIRVNSTDCVRVYLCFIAFDTRC